MKSPQKFASAHANIHKCFSQEAISSIVRLTEIAALSPCLSGGIWLPQVHANSAPAVRSGDELTQSAKLRRRSSESSH